MATEKTYYARITKYYLPKSLEIKRSIVWEAKFTRTKYINFKALADHQEEKLIKATRAYGEKIADNGIIKKPFDGWIIYNAVALFIAIYFIDGRSEIYEISIQDFIKEKYKSGEKSLSIEKARKIGVLLKI